ncbi:hypothetical protein [uncultured Dysosmobacter sp.]|uniref:hypothetical protein n=1 Tax=uncultured Dysosmobacter sp. TaxID=2591384 RepID=UPI00260DA20C|nr:hypothetical protein [uncultured Dysosmobacter sp.]
MKTLETIQKTYKVFKTLAMIAMILSFIWAGLSLAGVLCAAAWRNGGNVIGISERDALKLTQAAGLEQMIGILLGDFVFALTDGLLFFFTHRYLKQELADGTPFTLAGAEQVKSLGIKTIVMPLVAAIVSAVVCECFAMSHPSDRGNGVTLALGIALILFSLVLRHGAELFEGLQTEGCSDEKE